MYRLLRCNLPRYVFAGLISLAVATAAADTVVTNDGRWLVGDVQKTDSGYIVHTARGPMEVTTAQVARILVNKKTAPRTSEAPPAPPVDGSPSHPASTDVPTAPDRLRVLSLAADDVAAHRPMKAVKSLKTYFDAHPTPPDEPMIDALGIALSQADGVKGGLYLQAVDLFNHQTTMLEATRPGQKRWGIKWMPADEVDHLMQQRQKAQQAIDQAAANLSRISQDITSAQKERASLSWGIHTQRERADAERRIAERLEDLQKSQSTAQEEYARAVSAMVKPDFPTTIKPADLETVATAGRTHSPAEPPVAGGSTEDPPTTPNDPVESTNSQSPPSTPASTPPPAPRHTTQYGVAFAVAPGLAVTSAATVAGAARLEFQTADGGSLKGEVVRVDPTIGLALVKFTGGRVANLQLADRASSGAVQCIGYPDVDLFNPKPQVMQGTVAAVSKQWEARFEISPRLPGAPLLQNGKVIGVVLGDRDADPAHVPAVTPEALKEFLKDDAHPGTIATDPAAAVMQIVATK
jgi:S1-C subfamily serine protease